MSNSAAGVNLRSALFIVAVLATALFATLLLWGFVAHSPGSNVRVTDGDGNTYMMSLDTDDYLEIHTSRGYNIVVVEQGKVFVKDADCPGLDCVHHVAVSNVSESIICLPHHLVVEICDSNVKTGGVDAVQLAAVKIVEQKIDQTRVEKSALAEVGHIGIS